MTYIHIACVVFLITALGYISIRRKCKALQDKSNFTTEFSNLVIDYLQSRGENEVSINKAIMMSERMQNEMDSFGLISYKMPFADRMISNYPVVLNIIPIIKSGMHDRILGGNNLNQNVQILQNTILRYTGHLNEQGEEINKELRNPMSWFREGVGNLVSSPIWLLGYFNIITEQSLLDLKESKPYKIISGLVALGGVVFALIEVVQQLIKQAA